MEVFGLPVGGGYQPLDTEEQVSCTWCCGLDLLADTLGQELGVACDVAGRALAAFGANMAQLFDCEGAPREALALNATLISSSEDLNTHDSTEEETSTSVSNAEQLFDCEGAPREALALNNVSNAEVEQLIEAVNEQALHLTLITLGQKLDSDDASVRRQTTDNLRTVVEIHGGSEQILGWIASVQAAEDQKLRFIVDSVMKALGALYVRAVMGGRS